ncbi:hypothetical protein CRE_14001 [Caenorhabditis remanei]|uniref:Uncharacterized protein n=1 Tax=Caenorhabditis remanei TaxID=31234 RepID=E3M8R7_CAERE|nr:hypothetical protein CRE_14001 [Caenorhabditis remanei]
MRCVKSLMMNVLLETSNDAIMRIIQEELRDHRNRKKERKVTSSAPKIVGNSSALAALAAFGDGEDSDSDANDDRQRGDENDDVATTSKGAESPGEFKTPVGIPIHRKFSVKTDSSPPVVNPIKVVDGDVSRAQDSEKSERKIEEKDRKSRKKSKKRSRSRSRERDSSSTSSASSSSSSRRHRRSRSRSRSPERRRKRSRSSERRRDRYDRDGGRR